MIQNADGDKRMLVTQSLNLKNKKPEVLIKQLIQVKGKKKA